MNFYNKIIFIGLLLFSLNNYSQQAPQFTNYIYNTMSVNPAYTGIHGKTIFNILARTQWVGVEGGGNTQIFSYNGAIQDFGIGTNIMNDQIGPIREVSGDVNLAYKIEVRPENYLSFGLKLGGSYFSLDQSLLDAKDGGDPDILVNDNKITSHIGAGLYYYTNTFYMGLSIPNLITKNKIYKERVHFYAIAGYVFDLTPDIKFKPAMLFKSMSNSLSTLDVSLNFLFNERFNTGISWRINDSVSALLGFKINENFEIGYSYDLTTSYFRKVNNGTHEIFLHYEFENFKPSRELRCYYF